MNLKNQVIVMTALATIIKIKLIQQRTTTKGTDDICTRVQIIIIIILIIYNFGNRYTSHTSWFVIITTPRVSHLGFLLYLCCP